MRHAVRARMVTVRRAIVRMLREARASRVIDHKLIALMHHAAQNRMEIVRMQRAAHGRRSNAANRKTVFLRMIDIKSPRKRAFC